MYNIVKSKEKFSLKFIKKIQKLKVIGWKAEGIQSKYIKSKNKDSKKEQKYYSQQKKSNTKYTWYIISFHQNLQRQIFNK